MLLLAQIQPNNMHVTIFINPRPSQSIQYTYHWVHSDILYTAELPGPPTTLQLFYNDGGENGEQVNQLLI